MADRTTNESYTVRCPSAFRDRVEDLARRRGVTSGDIVRAILLMLPPAVIAGFPDPGGPTIDDRETVILQSGPSLGRPWRRKPRLQIRLAPGHAETTIRRALALALALDRGDVRLRVDRDSPVAAPPPPEDDRRLIRDTQEELTRLRAMISVLSFEPLPGGVRSREDALHVLGFPPGANPDADLIRARFRMLATIHHPDGGQGSHHRMSQLNAAMAVLRRNAA